MFDMRAGTHRLGAGLCVTQTRPITMPALGGELDVHSLDNAPSSHAGIREPAPKDGPRIP